MSFPSEAFIPIKSCLYKSMTVLREHNGPDDGNTSTNMYQIRNLCPKVTNFALYQFLAKVEFLSQNPKAFFPKYPVCKSKMENREASQVVNLT